MKLRIVSPPRLVNISEVFRSVQGEGGRTGSPSVFVRFSGCNLRCRWRNADGSESLCDTPYTSFRPERKMVAFTDLLNRVHGLLRESDDLVITGGEPMLYPEAVEALVDRHPHRLVTIETNGTRDMALTSENVLYSVSPKLGNSGSSVPSETVLQKLNSIRGAQIQLKFVCSNPVDLDEIDDFRSRIDVPSKLYLMPQGATSKDILQRLEWLRPMAEQRGYFITDRIHIHLWPGARGV